MAPEQLLQQMKFQWWRDLPRNVSRQEYDRFQLVVFGAIASGCFSLGALAMAVTGMTETKTHELATIPKMSVAEAATTTIDYDLVKLSGYLVGDPQEVLTMPDAPSQKVLRGHLNLVVQDGTSDGESNLSETLWDWSDAVERIAITDNQNSEIRVNVALAQFPLLEVEPEFAQRPRVRKTAQHTGDRLPSSVEYGEEIFELDPIKWRRTSYAYVKLERQMLPYGQAVVIVAALKDNQLVDPSGDRLRIALGTEEDILRQGQQSRWLMSILWLPLGGLSYLLGSKAIAKRQEFIMRSNNILKQKSHQNS